VFKRNKRSFKFLWDNKGDKIKQSEVIADCQDGGQKMLDIIEFNKALNFLNCGQTKILGIPLPLKLISVLDIFGIT